MITKKQAAGQLAGYLSELNGGMHVRRKRSSLWPVVGWVVVVVVAVCALRLGRMA